MSINQKRIPFIQNITYQSIMNHIFLSDSLFQARFSISPSMKQPLSQVITENPKVMNTMQSPSTSSTFLQSRYIQQRKNVTKKRLPFEDNVGLSEEEEDIMLAQCIRSGMPKVSCLCVQYVANTKVDVENYTNCKKNAFLFQTWNIFYSIFYIISRLDNISLVYFQQIYDDFQALSSISTTATSTIKKSEPCPKTTKISWAHPSSCFTNKTYSSKSAALHSPLYKSVNVNTTDTHYNRNVSSNLNGFSGRTTSSNIAQSGQISRNCDNGTRERINSSPYCAQRSSFRHAESENGNSVNNHCVPARSRVVKCAPVCNKVENNDYACKSTANIVPLRHSSVNSISEPDARISTQEWALLELCINSGMPTNKYRVKGMKPSESTISNGHDDSEPIPEDNYSVCSYNSYVFKT